MQYVPFNAPCAIGNEFQYMQEALSNRHISGDGPFTKKAQLFLETELKVPKVLLTSSCTHALELAALLLDIQSGNEVIVPDFTFVSTINAFVLRGAKPVFVDIRPDTLNLDEQLLEKAITPRTKAIVVVHYAGVGCEMAPIMDLADRHHIQVVEDNAHGLFGKYQGRPLGTFGAMATQSFHETKNFTSGEGGALVINDQTYVERAEILREKGTNRSRFFRGQIDKYTWVDIGSSYLMSDMNAAFLYAQLEHIEKVQTQRRHIWSFYNEHLAAWAEGHGIRLPAVPTHCEQPYHMFYMLMPSLAKRQEFIDYLRSLNINSVFHYLPLHLSTMGQRFGGKPGDCPVTEDVSDRLVRLPFFYNMTDEILERVVKSILAFD